MGIISNEKWSNIGSIVSKNNNNNNKQQTAATTSVVISTRKPIGSFTSPCRLSNTRFYDFQSNWKMHRKKQRLNANERIKEREGEEGGASDVE